MTEPTWDDVAVMEVQDRLSQQLGLAVQDHEDLITLMAVCFHDLILSGDYSRRDGLRTVRETIRDWLGSE